MKQTSNNQGVGIRKFPPVTFVQVSFAITRMVVVSVFFIGIGLFLPAGISIARAMDQGQSAIPAVLPSATLKTIIVADYYPYTFVNDKGAPDGFSVDIAKAVAGVMDRKLEIRVDTWETATNALTDGTIDLLPMMAYSPERDKTFDFSAPHTIAYDAVFLREGSPRINSLKDLAGKTIIVLNKDVAHQYLLSSGMSVKMKLVLVDSLSDALRTLAEGKGDAALMPKLVGMIVMKNLNLMNLDPSPVVIDTYTRPFCFAVKDKNQELLERLSQGLSIIKSTGQYQEIYKKWFGALEPPGLSWETIIKYVGAILVVFLLIGSGLILWTVSLKKQVSLRTKNLVAEIQERKRAEDDIRQIVNRLDLAQTSAKMGIWDWDIVTGYIKWTDQMFHLLGLDQTKSTASFEAWRDVFHPEDLEMAGLRIDLALKEKKKLYSDYRVVLPDGQIRWINSVGEAEYDDQGQAIRMIGICIDITERKQAEEELKRKESYNYALFEYNPNQTIAVDLEGKIIAVNRMKRLSGDQLPNIGSVMYRDYASNHEIDMYSELMACLGSGMLKVFPELKYRGKILFISIAPFSTGAVIISQDITDRKLAEKKIKASLREKETMLKEIHHRVKNNLQVISSLLGLQSGFIKDEDSRKIFQESQDRVKIMAQIHTMLYQSTDLARVDFGGFIRDLASRLQQSCGTAGSPIEIHTDITDISLTIDTSIPCGLILNELASNALKYAFPGGSRGRIDIGMTCEEGWCILKIQDNGIGFPKEIDFRNTQSLGLELVNLMVGQMDGTINMQVDGGTAWTIIFPIKDEREWKDG